MAEQWCRYISACGHEGRQPATSSALDGRTGVERRQGCATAGPITSLQSVQASTNNLGQVAHTTLTPLCNSCGDHIAPASPG